MLRLPVNWTLLSGRPLRERVTVLPARLRVTWFHMKEESVAALVSEA
jgi:hypothetical protein